jgi:short-subunit dehydrogenase
MKRAVIVGATSGLGMEVAKLLVERGWRVGVAGRRESKLNELKELAPQMIETQVIDIENDEAPALLNSLIERLGGMELYFHSSGVGWQNSELDVQKELTTCSTNVTGFTRMVLAAWHYFKERQQNSPDFSGGQIAVISSVASTRGLGPAAAYSATKAYNKAYIQALNQLTKSTKSLKIHFTEIRPGFVDTALLDTTKHHYPMLMQPQSVAKKIVRAVEKHKRVAIIDWRYKLLVFFWRLIPRPLWERLKL